MDKHTSRFTGVALVLFLAALLSACSAGGGIDLDQRAGRFIGGALSNYSGVDGDEPVARGTARDIAIAREFDFTPVGITIAAGAASTNIAGASTRFGDGVGTLAVIGDVVTVNLDIMSLDSSVANVDLSGTFSLSAAQDALADAGASFTVTWQFLFTEGITTYSVEADQVLSGTDWVDV